MFLAFEEYKKKVLGCYIGKSVGGTLGMPFEGDTNTRTITYYDPVPTEMLPNDDLDLQIVNLETILRTGLPVSRYNVGEIWLHHMEDSAPDEYGVAISNHRIGLRAPLSGQYRNKFYGGMGGAIRSELWACLAPANPTLAAQFAREDACTDHTKDGVYAEMFLAAVESAAFAETDLAKLIEIGISFIGKESKLYHAFEDVQKQWKNKQDVFAVREYILQKYPSDNWTDVTINISFVLLSLLACENSFDKAICTATSLGYDTDCTAATVGAIFGIMNPDCIDEKWTKPIGDDLILSACIINMHEWDTIGQFCDALMATAYHVRDYYQTEVEIERSETLKPVRISAPRMEEFHRLYAWEMDSPESLIAESPFLVNLIYPKNIALIPDQPQTYKLKITNVLKRDFCGKLTLALPEKWTATPSDFTFDLKQGAETTFEFIVNVTDLKRRGQKNILSLRFNVNGVPFVMETALPVACPWAVENLKTNENTVFEATSAYFNVPKGEYRYKTKMKATAKKDIRISCGGTRPFILYVNGAPVYEGKAEFYVPTFHRDNSWTTASLLKNMNEIEVYFPEYGEGEFFFGVGTTFGCSTWIDTLERML